MYGYIYSFTMHFPNPAFHGYIGGAGHQKVNISLPTNHRMEIQVMVGTFANLNFT